MPKDIARSMARINDVGGMHGFGPVDIEADAGTFHHEWEARVFAVNYLLMQAGLYNLDEFRDAIERMEPVDYLRASYYERWLAAIELLLTERGVSLGV
jgi:hypothetical protein